METPHLSEPHPGEARDSAVTTGDHDRRAREGGDTPFPDLSGVHPRLTLLLKGIELVVHGGGFHSVRGCPEERGILGHDSTTLRNASPVASRAASSCSTSGVRLSTLVPHVSITPTG